jgi:hypothetical protein
MFKVKGVAKLSKVQAWLDNPEGKEGDRFQDMSIAEFKRYQADRMRTHIQEKQSKAKGKKCAQSEVSDDESEDDGSYRTSKKGKGRRVLNSSDLDA